MGGPQFLVLVLVFVLGGAGGFGFAKLSSKRGETTNEPADHEGKDSPAEFKPPVPGGIDGVREKLAAATSADDVRDLWASFDDSAYADACRRLALGRWVEIDPSHALAYLLENGDERNHRELLLEWARISPADAVAAMDQNREQLARHVHRIDALLSLDGSLEACLEYRKAASKCFPHSLDRRSVERVFSSLWASDSESAIKQAESLEGDDRRQAMAGIAAAMARADIASARQWAGSLTNAQEKEAALGRIAFELGKIKPDEAALILKELNDPLGQRTDGARLIRHMMGEDPGATIDWVLKHFPSYVEAQSWVPDVLVQSLWAADEGDAIAAVASTSDADLRAKMIYGLSSYTNFRDIGKMLETVDELGDAGLRTEFRKRLVRPLAQDSVARARSYLESLPEEEAIPKLWEEVVKFTVRDVDSFWEVLERLPEENQTSYLNGHLGFVAESDPAAALEQLTRLEDRTDFARLTQGIARTWGTTEPEATMRWIESLPADAIPVAAEELSDVIDGRLAAEAFDWLQRQPLNAEQLLDATREIAQTWTLEDGIAASEFIRSLPSGPARQGAIEGLINSSYQRDPEGARAWLNQIENEVTRKALRKKIEPLLTP